MDRLDPGHLETVSRQLTPSTKGQTRRASRGSCLGERVWMMYHPVKSKAVKTIRKANTALRPVTFISSPPARSSLILAEAAFCGWLSLVCLDDGQLKQQNKKREPFDGLSYFRTLTFSDSRVYYRAIMRLICSRVFFSILDTCTCERPTTFATSDCVLSLK